QLSGLSEPSLEPKTNGAFRRLDGPPDKKSVLVVVRTSIRMIPSFSTKGAPMTVTITPLTAVFAGEVGAIDLRKVHGREALEAIRAGMDKYAVLVFRDQNFTNEEQLDFAQRFDGTLHARTSSSAIGNNRFGNEALADVSNVGPDGRIRDANNRMRASSVANRLWHTDASFVDPPGRYSML